MAHMSDAAPPSKAISKPPEVFTRDDVESKIEKEIQAQLSFYRDMGAYDHNFVETDKFEYILPVNDSKNFFHDPYATSAVVFAPLCTGVAMLKAAGMRKDNEWRGICCIYCKSLFCFP